MRAEPSAPDVPDAAGIADKLQQALRLLQDVGHDLHLRSPATPSSPGPDDTPVPQARFPDHLPLLRDFRQFLDWFMGVAIRVPSALAVAGVELTQSTQFFNFDGKSSGAGIDNSVPLIADKVTVLRVFVARRQGLRGYVPARLAGEVRVAGQTILPLNGPLWLKDEALLRRSTLDDSLNFRIPASLCRGTKEFKIVIYDPDKSIEVIGIYEDGSVVGRSSVTETLGAHFWPQPPMRVQGVLLSYAGPNPPNPPFNVAAPGAMSLVSTLARLLPMFPIHGFDFGPCATLNVTDDLRIGSGTKGSGWDSTLTTLANLRSASTLRTFFVGLLPKGLPATVGAPLQGIGRPGCAIAAQDATRALAHELGHACSRDHLNDGVAPIPWDSGYPKYGTFPKTSIGEYGLNTDRMTLFDPNSDRDFMGYFDAADVTFPTNTWISPHNYMDMLNLIKGSDGTGDLAFSISAVVVSPMMMLNFRLHREGKIELRPSWIVTNVLPLTAPPSAIPARVEVVGRDGEILFSGRCHQHNDYQDPDGPYLDFHELVPWPADATGFAVIRDGKKIGGVTATGSQPRIALRDIDRTSGDGRIARLRWSVRGDDEQRAVLIRYTHDDGRTFHAVAAGVSGSSHIADLDLLPGGKRCCFEISVATGLNSTSVRTKSFAVPLKPRKAEIVSPRDGDAFRTGAPLSFLGGGHSPDGGVCEPDEIAWHSNLEGFLGTGYHVVCEHLREGLHKITVSLPDGQNGEATSSIRVRIGEGSRENHCD